MTVPYKLEGTFVVPLAHENLVGRVLEVGNEIGEISKPEVGLEYIEYIVECSSGSAAPEGIHRGFMVIARWVLLEH